MLPPSSRSNAFQKVAQDLPVEQPVIEPPKPLPLPQANNSSKAVELKGKITLEELSNRPLPTDQRISIRKLPNGVTTYIASHDEPAKEEACLRLVVRVGAIYEQPDERGLAHFVEHITFSNTPSFPDEKIRDTFDSMGSPFGPDTNARTGPDFTEYILNIPLTDPDNLETAIKALYEISCKADPRDEDIERERAAVLDELRMRRGLGYRFVEAISAFFLKGTPQEHRLAAGDPKVVEACSPDKLRDFYKRWYTPDRMAVIAVGDFDTSEVTALIERYFGAIPSNPNPIKDLDHSLKANEQDRCFRFADPELTQTQVGVDYLHYGEDLDPDRSATLKDLYLSLVHSVTMNMLRTRMDALTKVDQPSIAHVGARVGNIAHILPHFELEAVPYSGRMEEAVECLVKEVRRCSKHGFLQQELETVRSSYTKLLEQQKEELGKDSIRSIASGCCDHFVHDSTITDPAKTNELLSLLLPSVDVDVCQRWIQKLLDTKARVVSAIEPKNKEYQNAQEQELLAALHRADETELEPYSHPSVERSLMDELPHPGKIVDKSVHESSGVTTYTLSNGMKVSIKPIENDENFIRIYTVTPLGLLHANEEERPSARVADQIAHRSGVAGFNQRELELLLKDTVGSWNRSLSSTFSTFSAVTGKKDLETMLQLHHLSYVQPGYRKEVFDDSIERIRLVLEHREQNPDARLSKEILLHNTQRDPSRAPLSIEDLSKARYDHATQFHQKVYSNPARHHTIITGSVTEEVIEPLIEKYLASLPEGESDLETRCISDAPFPPGISSKDIYAGQEETCLTYLTFPTKDETRNIQKRYRRHCLAHILNKRILKRLRQELEMSYTSGCCYSAPLHPQLQQAFSQIQLSCHPNNIDRAEQAVLDVIRDLQENGPTEEEVEAMKKTVIHNRHRNHSTSSGWKSILTKVFVRGETLDQWAETDKELEGITAEELQTTAQYLNTKHYSRVTLIPQKYDSLAFRLRRLTMPILNWVTECGSALAQATCNLRGRITKAVSSQAA